MKYNKDILDRFINEKAAINVETQQEWDDFMKLLEEETDCKWRNACLPTYRNYWTNPEEDTSVAFNFYGCSCLGFGTVYFFREEGCEVIKYKDLIMEEVSIEKLWEALSEEDKEEVGYVLGNKTFEDGYWKEVFHKLGKGKEYDAFYTAYNEINNAIPSDYLG